MDEKKKRWLLDGSIALSVVVMLSLLASGHFGLLALTIIPVLGLFLLTHKKPGD